MPIKQNDFRPNISAQKNKLKTELLHIDNRLQRWGGSQLKKGGIFETRIEAIEKISSNFYERYPFMKNFMKNNPVKPKNNTFDRCLFYKSKAGNQKNATLTNIYVTNSDPGFKDAANNDWTLTPTPEARKALGEKFTPPPFQKMGIQK